MYSIKDGPRTLQFEGELLGSSSSWVKNSVRWIEFKLYRTEGGTYILSRVGVSMVYHVASCPIVTRYSLREIPVGDLKPESIGCPECLPTLQAPYVFPEKDRPWATTTNEPSAVLEALYKYDDNGSRYLTKVAERLLERAAEVDPDLDQVYRIETIL